MNTFVKYLKTFFLFHLLLFTVFGVGIAIIDKMDTELFAFLVFTTILFGVPGALLQASIFTLVRNFHPVNTWLFVGLALLVEYSFMNVVYTYYSGESLIAMLLTRSGSGASNVQNSIVMHVAIVTATLIMARFHSDHPQPGK